ncbi:hypothetical protein [Streptomyces sp. NPDC001889]
MKFQGHRVGKGFIVRDREAGAVQALLCPVRVCVRTVTVDLGRIRAHAQYGTDLPCPASGIPVDDRARHVLGTSRPWETTYTHKPR